MQKLQILFQVLCMWAAHITMKSLFSNSGNGSLGFAKFTPGAIVSEIRNKIAATVYSKNKAGAIIRNRITPINRRSAGQTNARQVLAGFSSDFRGLTAAQIAAWNAAAANFPQTDNLGQTIFLTGAQLYQRCNNNLQLIGQPGISDPPNPTSFAVLTATSLTIDASAQTVSFAFTPTVPTGFSMVTRATRPVSAGKSFFPQSAYRFLKAIAAAATSPQVLSTQYLAVFGSLLGAAGQKVSLEAFLVEDSSGLAGIPVRVDTVVVA